MLEITGLTKTYPGGKKALTDVNISIASCIRKRDANSQFFKK